MSRPPRGERLQRYAEEDLLALLMVMRIDLDELSVRIGQAMQRTSLVRSVLEPGLERLDELRTALDQAQDAHRRRAADQ